jgi:ribose 5-phosphate isomerase B
MASPRLRVAFGTVALTPTVEAVRRVLLSRQCELVDVEPPAVAGHTWPEVGRRVALLVSQGRADSGVAFCWTGTGIAISAAGVSGVRAAYCASPADASGAREWHDANLLALSLWQAPEPAAATTRAWIDSERSHDARHVDARRRLAATLAA